MVQFRLADSRVSPEKEFRVNGVFSFFYPGLRLEITSYKLELTTCVFEKSDAAAL